jgi:DNA primase
LTPHTHQNKKNFYYKKTIKSLDSTKKIFKDSQSLTGVELKEYSLLYLMINNLNLIQENIHLIDNIKLFTEVNTQIFNEIVSILKSGEKLTVNEMNIDKQLLDKIDKFAPIKHLLKNKSKNKYELIELLDDIGGDLKNYDLENRVKELELKFSKDPSEATFNDLKNEKKKQNIN